MLILELLILDLQFNKNRKYLKIGPKLVLHITWLHKFLMEFILGKVMLGLVVW